MLLPVLTLNVDGASELTEDLDVDFDENLFEWRAEEEGEVLGERPTPRWMLALPIAMLC